MPQFPLLFFGLTVVYGLFLTYLAIRLKAEKPESEKNAPSLSIVVSMHNEQENAEACVSHLLAQNYPREKLEIIIIDDRSDDETGNILDQLAATGSIKVIHIRELTAGFAPKKKAIDTALKQAKGSIILLTDADGRPGPEWARTMAGYFDERTGMVIGYAPYSTDTPFDSAVYKLLSIEYFTHAAAAAASSAIGYPATCVGTNMAYRKEVYEELGGFGPFASYLSGDDDLFLTRVRDESDWKIRYAADARCQVFNAPPGTFRRFYQQRIRYASKGFMYPLPLTLALAAFYFLNVGYLLLPLLSLFYPWLLKPLLAGLAIKFAGEWFFIIRARKVLNELRHGFFLIPAAILLIPYIVYFGFMAQIQSFEWAGQRH